MEQITFVPIETSEGNISFRLSVFYDYNLYETEITNEIFTSEFVEIDALEDLIQEGLKPSIANKIDDNLKVSTTFDLNSIDDILKINLDLKYQKGRLKPRTEKFEFLLTKKEIDNQTTLENVLRGLKKSFNIPQVNAGSSNIYIHIYHSDRVVSYYCSETGRTILVNKGIEIKPDFLDLMLSRDEPLCKFFTNRLNSQEAINGEISKAIDRYFDTSIIFELIINYMSRKYCVNFIQVFKKGSLIMMNVLLKKQPKESIYYVCDDITNFEFDTKLNYRVLCEFEYKMGQNQIKDVENNIIEISYNENGQMNIFKNGEHDITNVYMIRDINGKVYWLKSSSYSSHQFYSDKLCTVLTTETKLRFKSGVGINLSNGTINGNSVYLSCCHYDGNCSCRNITGFPMTRFPIYTNINKVKEVEYNTYYLIEQF